MLGVDLTPYSASGTRYFSFQTVHTTQNLCYFVRKSKNYIKLLQFLTKSTTHVPSSKQTKHYVCMDDGVYESNTNFFLEMQMTKLRRSK